MISVSHLTRRFGRTVAVNDVSFEVQRGEIVGFLGPNGAGKTTTMRILAGFLPPSDGEAFVNNHSAFSDSLEVRRCVGYLPEHCPLYKDMRVDEYLKFRAGIKGVPARRKSAQRDRVKELCGLEDTGRKIIGTLSKGYQQRVGLADAMIHDPALLILDEPTIGLDPHQIRVVRELIKRLAEQHTVLLSSHILSEVEMTCKRVLIINEGRIVASDSTEALKQRREGVTRITLECQCAEDEFRRVMAGKPFISDVQINSDGEWLRAELVCTGSEDCRPEVFQCAVDQGWAVRELHMARQSLEDIFVKLTGDNAGGGAS